MDHIVTPRKKVTNRLRTIYPLNPTFKVYPRSYVRRVTADAFDTRTINNDVFVNFVYYSTTDKNLDYPAGVYKYRNSGLT